MSGQATVTRVSSRALRPIRQIARELAQEDPAGTERNRNRNTLGIVLTESQSWQAVARDASKVARSRSRTAA